MSLYSRYILGLQFTVVDLFARSMKTVDGSFKWELVWSTFFTQFSFFFGFDKPTKSSNCGSVATVYVVTVLRLSVGLVWWCCCIRYQGWFNPRKLRKHVNSHHISIGERIIKTESAKNRCWYAPFMGTNIFWPWEKPRVWGTCRS